MVGLEALLTGIVRSAATRLAIIFIRHYELLAFGSPWASDFWCSLEHARLWSSPLTRHCELLAFGSPLAS